MPLNSVVQCIMSTFLSAGAGADVDSYVVDTNYDEYVMLYQQSTEKPSGNTTLGVKLYSEWILFFL